MYVFQKVLEIRELSKATSTPYNFVHKLFTTTFPTYEELPEFDEKGNIIPMYNLAAADITSEEESRTAA